jgi:hypothetical protein
MTTMPNDVFRLPLRRPPIAAINKDRRAGRIRLVALWLAREPGIKPTEILKLFASGGIELTLVMAQDYIRAARRLNSGPKPRQIRVALTPE